MTNQDRNHSPLAQLTFFSFWKPEPLPNKKQACVVRLLSIGTLSNITHQLTSIQNMKIMLKNPFSTNRFPIMRLLWDVREGVILQYRSETTTGDVLSIEAISATSDATFHNLYAQIYEQFGIIVLDELSHNFYTPKEFKSRCFSD